MSNLPAMTFGQFIKARRLELGYKFAEIAKKSGISEPSLRQYEQDLCRPFATNLYKLAAAYELTANDLEPYELKHKSNDKAKPVAKIQIAIRHGIKDIEHIMNGSSPFEQKMKLKLLESLGQCNDILEGVKFLDDAF